MQRILIIEDDNHINIKSIGNRISMFFVDKETKILYCILGNKRRKHYVL